MRHIVGALVLGLVAVGPAGAAEAVDKKELKSLQGEWVAQRIEKDGMKSDVSKAARPLTLKFEGAKWIFTGVEKGKIIALDPKAKPKSLDLESTEKGIAGEVAKAIYKLEKDTLTICLREGKGKGRPKEFKSEDADTIVIVFKRAAE